MAQIKTTRAHKAPESFQQYGRRPGRARIRLRLRNILILFFHHAQAARGDGLDADELGYHLPEQATRPYQHGVRVAAAVPEHVQAPQP